MASVITKKIIITFLLFLPVLSHATLWRDPDFEEAVHAAGLICTGIVETSSPQKTTIRITSIFKGLYKQGDVVTIFRSKVVGVGHANNRLRAGEDFLFIVKNYKNGFIAFTDTYWHFPIDDSTVTLPIRDPSAYITIKRTSFELFLTLLLKRSSTEETKAFVSAQMDAVAQSPVITKSSGEVQKQVFALEVVYHFGDSGIARLITPFIKSPFYQVRWSCVRALTTCGGETAKRAILDHLLDEENERVQSVLGHAVFTLHIVEAKPMLEKQIPNLSTDDYRISSGLMSPISNTLPPARYAYAAALMKINGIKGTYHELLGRAQEYLAHYPGIRFNILEGKESYYTMEEALKHPDAVYILVLAKKDLTEVPQQIRTFRNLKSLSLIDNKLKDLPDFLSELSLIELNVNENVLENVPEVVYRCTTLEDLNMGGNEIRRLSANISNLNRLKKLDLRMCGLDALPEEIAQLDDLVETDLYGNYFYQFPTVLTKCASLREINLGSNKIKNLPMEIASMPKVKFIDLSYNELTLKERERASLLPAGVHVSTQTYADRYYSVNEAVENNSEAQVVHDNHNDYRSLTLDLGVLKKAETVVLTYNQFSAFPPGLTNLGNLQSLVLHHNDIEEVPADINRMKSLVRLDLSFNKLKKLPVTIKELPLTYLNLSNNEFSEEEKKIIQGWFNEKCRIVW